MSAAARATRRRLLAWSAGSALGAGLLAGAAPASALDRRDRMIVAGVRVGAITPATPPEALPRIYGQAHIRFGAVPAAEGDSVAGAFLLRGTADALEIGFTDDRRGVAYVRIVGRRWHTAAGLRIGTTLADLERINGGPFLLSGFSWDFGGRVLDAQGGQLPRSLLIVLAPTRSLPPAESDEVSGKRRLSSRHPVLRRLGVVVAGLAATFRP